MSGLHARRSNADGHIRVGTGGAGTAANQVLELAALALLCSVLGLAQQIPRPAQSRTLPPRAEFAG